MGEDGYLNSCIELVSARRKLEAALEKMEDLYVIGKPIVSVVSFSSKTLNIYFIGDEMSSRGWSLNALQDPPALHVACTIPVAKSIDKLISDLMESIEEVRNKPNNAPDGSMR